MGRCQPPLPRLVGDEKEEEGRESLTAKHWLSKQALSPGGSPGRARLIEVARILHPEAFEASRPIQAKNN